MNQAIRRRTPVYFTILPSNAGFTDQIYQFSVFYKLGLSLEYIYLHSNYISTREGSEDIYDFLGFNESFSRCTLTNRDALYRLMGTNNCTDQKDVRRFGRIKRYIRQTKFWLINKFFFNEFNFIDIGLGDDLLHTQDLDPINYFQNLVRDIVEKNHQTNARCKDVVRFYLLSGKYFFLKLAPLTSRKIPYFQDNLDLYSIYIKNARNQTIKPKFDNNKIKLEMHIRLGDTALIETPWNSFVPLWSGCPIRPLKEYPDKNDKVFNHSMDVNDYWKFIKKLVSYFNSEDLSIAIFSDGYNTAFKEVLRMISDLNLDSDRIRALKDSSLTYEKQRFSVFDSIENCECVIGENNEALKELVSSSLAADVIIVGCNQNMITKLLMNYHNQSKESPVIIVLLYRVELPDYQVTPGDNVVTYPVDVTNLESNEELIKVVDIIKLYYINHFE